VDVEKRGVSGSARASSAGATRRAHAPRLSNPVAMLTRTGARAEVTTDACRFPRANDLPVRPTGV
jgi:hypothetical protein